MGLALTRYVLRFPPAAELHPEEITAWLAPTVQHYPCELIVTLDVPVEEQVRRLTARIPADDPRKTAEAGC